MSVLQELEWRGLLYDQSRDVEKVLAEKKVVAYVGFDPSADSLHIGHMLPMLGLARLQRAGHTPIALVGGGTGLIGDPSGKSAERTLMSTEQVEENVAGIRKQLGMVLDFDARDNAATIMNNADWLKTVPLLEFLRDIGKHFTVNAMLAKDSVSRRLEQEEGLSFTEFSYMVMQAYDFLTLFDRRGCILQIGGSDQWGNITAGMDLIRRKRSTSAHGVVFPLITDSSGAKFGKTAAGTSVWLDPKRTSPFKFYQFWMNLDDRDVINYLKVFTFLDRATIGELTAAVADRPSEREAQRALAAEVTRMVHGETALDRAEAATGVLFGGDLGQLPASDLLEIFDDAPSSELAADLLQGDGITLAELLKQTGVAPSKSEARRLLSGGGIHLNNRRERDGRRPIGMSDTIEGRLLLLRKGRKHYHLVRVVGASS